MDLDKIVKKIRNSELSEDDVLKYGRILITEFAKEYHKKQLMLDDVVGRRELLKAFADKWNIDNDIADSPIIHDGFIDEFLKSL